MKQIIDILKGGTLAVAGETTVYSKSFPLPSGASPDFSFEFLAASSGAVKLKLELEQANVFPDTEQAADDNYVVPDSALELIDALEDTNVHIKAYPPAATLFARLKVTGLALNDASTVLSRANAVYIK